MTIRVGIVYFSAEGATAALADALSHGVASVTGVEALPFRITGDAIVRGRHEDEPMLEHLDGCAAVIFGSPTYMGGPAAPFKAFADATSDRWVEQRWRDKLAAGFTAGANPAGDQLATLQYLALLAAQHGMLWAGLDIAGGFDPRGRNRLGSQLGVASWIEGTEPHPDDLATARYLGERVARLCGRSVGEQAGRSPAAQRLCSGATRRIDADHLRRPAVTTDPPRRRRGRSRMATLVLALIIAAIAWGLYMEFA